MSKVWFITGAGSGIGAATARAAIRAGDVAQVWSALDGQQPGDPAKLGEVLVRIASMDDSPKQFLAGSDALAIIKPVLEGRLRELHVHEALSRSTDGGFQ